MAGKRTINGVIARALANARADGRASRTWAVVDAARDPRIHHAATAANARGICLYGDDVPKELAQVAPWLVPMPPDSSFGALFATSGRGNAWGIVTRSDASTDVVAKHFVGLLRAKVPDGRTLLFRFYDPRVLATYLPTCTASELDHVFGPCNAFLVDGATGGAREYCREGSRLVVAEPRWDRWIE